MKLRIAKKVLRNTDISNYVRNYRPITVIRARFRYWKHTSRYFKNNLQEKSYTKGLRNGHWDFSLSWNPHDLPF